MIGLDTNVLIRYITQDDPEQAARANALLDPQEKSPSAAYLVNHIVMVEMVWILMRAYRYPKPDIIAVLQALMSTAQITIPDKHLVEDALQSYRSSTADFSDCLLVASNQKLGCTETLTFDTKAGQLASARLL